MYGILRLTGFINQFLFQNTKNAVHSVTSSSVKFEILWGFHVNQIHARVIFLVCITRANVQGGWSDSCSWIEMIDMIKLAEFKHDFFTQTDFKHINMLVFGSRERRVKISPTLWMLGFGNSNRNTAHNVFTNVLREISTSHLHYERVFLFCRETEETETP